MRNTTLWALGLAAAMTATAAWAVTVEETTADAEALLVQLEDVEADVAACPDGECAEVATIIKNYRDLEPAHDRMHAHREELGPSCGCSELDALIEQVDDLHDALGVVVGDWEDEIN